MMPPEMRVPDAFATFATESVRSLLFRVMTPFRMEIWPALLWVKEMVWLPLPSTLMAPAEVVPAR